MQRIKTELAFNWLSLERGIMNYFYSFIFHFKNFMKMN